MKTLTEEQKEQIKRFYEPFENEEGLFLNKNGVIRFIRFSNTPYFLHFEGDASNEFKEALKNKNDEEAYKIGEKFGVLTLTGKELYFNIAPELYDRNLPDPRTTKYLDSVKKNIGLIEYDVLDQDVKFNEKDADDKMRIWINTHEVSDVHLKKQENNAWFAQYWVRDGIDTFSTTVFEFRRKPNVEDIKSAYDIMWIEAYMRTKEHSYFNCWECGRKTHWLDGNGKNIHEKLQNFREEKECQNC